MGPISLRLTRVDATSTVNLKDYLDCGFYLSSSHPSRIADWESSIPEANHG